MREMRLASNGSPPVIISIGEPQRPFVESILGKGMSYIWHYSESNDDLFSLFAAGVIGGYRRMIKFRSFEETTGRDYKNWLLYSRFAERYHGTLDDRNVRIKMFFDKDIQRLFKWAHDFERINHRVRREAVTEFKSWRDLESMCWFERTGIPCA
jgi:hypothetical protein